jgi:hypothetical protein
MSNSRRALSFEVGRVRAGDYEGEGWSTYNAVGETPERDGGLR